MNKDESQKVGRTFCYFLWQMGLTSPGALYTTEVNRWIPPWVDRTSCEKV